MPREKREWFPGAVYHVMSRGNYRREIFKDKEDFQVFQMLMRKAVDQYHIKIHAYCLMTNHYHMLMETEDKAVWLFMKSLNSLYAAYHNEKYHMMGHLFQGRYKGCLVKDDAYFLQTSRYVHLNPVKAGMVEHAEDYPWSSYRTMIGMTDDKLTYVRRTHAYFGKNPVFRYREFIEDIGHKYRVQENAIQKDMGEDELWLPW